MQTKLLATLVALQCAGIAFLVYRALGDAPAPATPVPALAAQAAAPASTPDEERLRQVIREELSAQLAAAPAAAGATRVAAAPVAPRDADRDRQQRERVASQIEHYRSVGRISDTEMMDLQGEIALLDPASRREMLGKLSRAMNAQEIQGRM
jgi:hypothetical protein